MYSKLYREPGVRVGLVWAAVKKLRASGRGFERNVAIVSRELYALIDEVSYSVGGRCDAQI